MSMYTYTLRRVDRVCLPGRPELRVEAERVVRAPAGTMFFEFDDPRLPPDHALNEADAVLTSFYADTLYWKSAIAAYEAWDKAVGSIGFDSEPAMRENYAACGWTITTTGEQRDVVS